MDKSNYICLTSNQQLNLFFLHQKALFPPSA
uniref:Uncharacterized protein n=1 Tax=Myoviridae sp. ct0f722 TaxID=2827599 RepID=A0A8S5LPV0_9CAUD|nr:MAG TPA: hypothetical protein [Myoviridae sp. ct0f722]